MKFSFAECNTPIEVCEDVQADVEDTLDFAIVKPENNLINFKLNYCESPKEKASNCSSLRFGIGPLESIEESQGEDMLYKNEAFSIASHKSQQASPRLMLMGMEKTTKTVKASTRFSYRNKERKFTNNYRKKIKSPYETPMHIGSSKLPLIKNTDQAIKCLKGFKLSKRK